MKKLIATIFFALSLPFFVFAANEDIISALDAFYSSAKEENIQKYINSQDVEYLNSVYSKPEFYENNFKAAFSAFDTASYQIIDPSVVSSKDGVLVFYNLKGALVLTETKETKNIDNDMVALLVNINGAWKVRYTILRSQYEFDLEKNVLDELSSGLTIGETDEANLKQEMIDAGLYKEENYNLLDGSAPEVNSQNTETTQSYNPNIYGIQSTEKNYRYKIIFVLIVIAGAYAFGKKKYPEKTDEIVNKIIEIGRTILAKIVPIFKQIFEKLIELSKTAAKKIGEIIADYKNKKK